MRPFSSIAVVAASLLVHQPSRAQENPLPAASELRARALDSYRKSEQARERYICRERIEDQELDSSGRIKKTETLEREIFYVNGFQISQPISKDGKPITGSALKKRDEDVRKAIESASANRKPKEPGAIKAGDILRLAALQNERRILVAGRPTIVFDVVPNPAVKADSIEQKFVAATVGTVSIDEATGNLQDLNLVGVRDVKVGGGLVANVHKGFAVHLLTAPLADGVWLLKLAEGTGNARVGLFFHPSARFRQETQGCQVYDVSTTQSDKLKVPSPSSK